jgi:hypothetical protein
MWIRSWLAKGMLRSMAWSVPEHLGYRFRRAGAVDRHHDSIRFCWKLAREARSIMPVTIVVAR